MRLLVTGASGQLGAYVLREAQRRGHELTAWSGLSKGEQSGVALRAIDLTDRDTVAAAFRATRPQAVLHTAALARVADCLNDPAAARRINTETPAFLADLAAEGGARLLHVSTDLVFDGKRGHYSEADPPAPTLTYGRTKADAEPGVLSRPGTVVARVSLLFGPSLSGRPTFLDEQVRALREKRRLALFTDEWRTPISFRCAAGALLDLLASDYTGLIHVGGPERLSRHEMGLRLAAHVKLDPAPFMPVLRASHTGPEPRPRDTSLDSARWRTIFPHAPWPAWEEALSEMGVKN